MCSALVSRHGFKNDIHFMCSALVSPHGWEIFSLSLANWPPKSPIDSCRDELSPSVPIESVCQNLRPLLLLLTSYFRYHRSSALRPFLVPVAIRLNPPVGGDNPTQVGCIGRVWWNSAKQCLQSHLEFIGRWVCLLIILTLQLFKSKTCLQLLLYHEREACALTHSS